MKDTYMIKDFLKEYQDKQVSVDSILSKPVGGWTIFRIGNAEYKLSYMTDLPSIWLDTMIRDFGYSYVVFWNFFMGYKRYFHQLHSLVQFSSVHFSRSVLSDSL